MSQHPDNEAAEKYASAIVGKCELQDELAKAHKAGANHVRASLAPELEKIREALEHYANHESVIKEAYHSSDQRQITCVHTFINHKAREALEILSRLMGKEGA